MLDQHMGAGFSSGMVSRTVREFTTETGVQAA